MVLSDPRKRELIDEFFCTGRHLLRLAQIIKTLELIVVDADDIGLALRLVDIAKPGFQGHISLFLPDGGLGMAMSDLHADADALLPDLPVRSPLE